MQEIILVDIDGTTALGIGSHRKAWDYDKVGADKPNHTVWQMLEHLSRHYKLVFLSGRENVTFPGKSERKDKCYRRAYLEINPEDNREYRNCFDLTRNWLKYWFNIYNINQMVELYMREKGDNRQDSVVKKELYYEHITDNYSVQLVLDDRDQVVKMWRNDLGLICFQVAEGDF
tara:strand:- start:33573 stop:34094 length:522 start_codon:yes stop_codon:yes gene_type:complete